MVNKQIKFFMLSYTGNEEQAEQTKFILEEKYNINCKIIYGDKIGKVVKYKIVLHNFYKYLLPEMINYGGLCYYIEDDVRFTKNPLDYIPEDVDVYWSVYRRIAKATVVGAQAILFNNKALNLLEKYDRKLFKYTHIDIYFTKFFKIMEKVGNIEWKIAEKKIGYEYDHTSLISRKKDWSVYTRPNQIK